MAETATTVKKFIDQAGLAHFIEKLYERGFKGMGLSKNDFTDAMVAKLNSTATTEGMAELTERLAAVEKLIESDKDGAINKFNEIVAFLAGVEDTKTLEGVLSAKANTADVYTKAQADAAFATPAAVDTKLEPYAKTADVTTELGKKVGNSDFNTAMEGKADKATTLSGYGIADAKIADGVITLGAQSITPLTEHQDISGKLDAADLVAMTNNEIDALINA